MLRAKGFFNLLVILQVGLMMVASSSSFVVPTKIGVHCPTAKVQFVQEIVANNKCCPPKVIVRAPRIGEPGFKQCLCAEKKASKQEAEKESLTGQGERFDLLPLTSQRFNHGKLVLIGCEYPQRVFSLVDHPSEPLIPPPNFI
jgi:hypothetical protein